MNSYAPTFATPRTTARPSRVTGRAVACALALALSVLMLSGCHSNGEPVVDLEPAPGPLNSTILLPVVRLSPTQSPIRQAAIDPSVTRQQTIQIMDDISSRRKTVATLSPIDRERLKVFLAAQKSGKLKALGDKLE